MQVKMSEHYQGRGHSALQLPENQKVDRLLPNQEYEVSADLGAWLVEHGKAEEIKKVKPVHYGAQAEPELRDDEKLHVAQVEEPEEPKAEPEKPVRARSKKRGRKQ